MFISFLFILLLYFSGADCFRAGNPLSYACTGFTKESIDEVMAAIPKAEEDYEEEDEKVDVIQKRRKKKRDIYHKAAYKSKEWILKKKERQRRDEKYIKPSYNDEETCHCKCIIY